MCYWRIVLNITEQIRKNIKYLRQLAVVYPSIQSVCTEIINLRAILTLPKGTEHFLSDLHGEHEAFTHILNNCSGVIREKMDDLFGITLTAQQRSELCSLVYYPRQKLEQLHRETDAPDIWREWALRHLIALCKNIASKYTRSKVRKALPAEFSYIIDELLHADYSEQNQSEYYEKIMESIIALHNADGFIIALATLIKRLAVDRLHIVGDIFDRGSRPDVIMDMLMEHHNVDLQWGNHDILWMAAAAGHSACVAAVVANSAAFCNLDVLEQGYGINLRPLAMFADKTYRYSEAFAPRLHTGEKCSKQEAYIAAKIHKAITVILFKLEGRLIMRHPEYDMDDRLMLDKIDYTNGMAAIGGRIYEMNDTHFPTVEPGGPFCLSPEEERIMRGLQVSFVHSQRLQKHVRFLYSNGGMYSCANQNLLFHGCIPMNEDGSFAQVELCGATASGRALMDHAEAVARTGYFGSGDEKNNAMDAMWYLWCGKLSPLFGRDKMTTFERRFISDEETWVEIKNSYYRLIDNQENCIRILEEFGLYSEISHIINGHVPVKAGKGENPVKAGGKLIVIDGGFCKAYQPHTGIAGYTLIYNSYGLRLSAHMPFESVEKAIAENLDILSYTSVFETMQQRIKVMDTDIGQEISEKIYDLSLLLTAYRSGEL
ncbi:MAG: fructose-1,6-bisphosphatase [Oscillospiraceae bacterium]|nr:fructose-1,6-bisphosphatase [Oscillospiraceae bacterium]